MRVLLLVLLVATSCERNEAVGDPRGSAARPVDDTAREQARFDAERHPEKVVEALGIGPGGTVADIGAGSGLLTVHLARAVKPNGRVVATDIDGAVLDLLQSRLAAAGLADLVERRVVGAEQPGLEAGSYDAILLAEVDHYFSDEVTWLKEAARALKPGGRIVISNRIHHRQKSMAAAQRAGLTLASESTPVPTHFIAVFTAGPGPASSGAR
ncbi:MAG TPA: class I SAM-dependent methyltransferase [Kofleriaceae bacterium]|nr:class I SAM-dependent methyltransferase [Kofleriaceae bacterium]